MKIKNTAKTKNGEKPNPLHDWTTETPAHVMMAWIESYWKERGFKNVKFWLEKVYIKAHSGSRDNLCIRSNLVNGLPPKEEV